MSINESSNKGNEKSVAIIASDDYLGACADCGKYRDTGAHQQKNGIWFISCLAIPGLVPAKVALQSCEDCPNKGKIRQSR